MTKAKVTMVDFDRIEVGVLGNPRSKLKNIPELAASIKENGLLEPLVVWHKHLKTAPHELPDGRKVWDRYILIAGNRRHAALALNRDEDPGAHERVPVTLFIGTEDDARFAAIAENIEREDLNPVDIAEAVNALSLRGHTQGAIAKRLAKSQAWISRLLKFRQSAGQPLRRAVLAEKVSFDVALTLCELDESKQEAALERYSAKEQAAGKSEARRQAKRDAGRIVRPSAKTLTREYEHLIATSKSVPDKQVQPISLAIRVLAYALGHGEWPNELPRPEAQAARTKAVAS